jgi:hypothetical protein
VESRLSMDDSQSDPVFGLRLIQFRDRERIRVARVEDAERVHVLALDGGTYALAQRVIQIGKTLVEVVESMKETYQLRYQQLIDSGDLLPPITHPDPAHALVSGTGLTHLGSADTRDSMHANLNAPEGALTDSMKMFKLGLDNGKPSAGKIGAQPEWFYKGDGSILVAPYASIPVPGFALDAGEEPELDGIYLIGPDQLPYRIGFALGNEFSDHVTERHNYLWLAHSKLRNCAFGPELCVGRFPRSLEGASRLFRDGAVIWEKPFLTGTENMCHSIANLEHHHFKYSQFRRPGDLHIHFFGTSTLSFADGIKVAENDEFEISAPGFGRPLRNSVHFVPDEGQATVTAI